MVRVNKHIYLSVYLSAVTRGQDGWAVQTLVGSMCEAVQSLGGSMCEAVLSLGGST